MPVDISSHYLPANLPFFPNRIRRQSQWILDQLDQGNHTVSLLFVDDEEISRLNSQYRQKEGPTNVLSFPLAEGDSESLSALPVSELGDVVISLDTAQREAIEMNQPFQHRLGWLIIHGILHLVGYDHERSDRDADIMFAKEQELLKRLEQRRRRLMPHLAINVDHFATVRQARGTNEPDPVTAAALCELAGAAGIVVHLREDRRHIQDRDVKILRETVRTKLNLEMGAAKEIINFALEIVPDMVTLVPEKRQELTTEGGLDVISQKKKLAKTIEKMTKKGIPVSIFIDPDPKQIKASLDIGATFVEIHTGRYSDAESELEQDLEFQLIENSAQEAYQMGLRVNAGHGLDYMNTTRVAALDTIEELSIGHAVISRALFVGIDQAVREMLALVQQTQTSL